MNQKKGNGSRIEILANGMATTVAAGSLADVVSELGHGDVKVATALNGEFVPERARGATPVKAGDRVEVLSARQGG